MTINVGRNVIWNLIGTILPVMAGLIAMPVLLHSLGTGGLGIFSLALGLIGFSGLLDLGLGRGLTQVIATECGRGRSPNELVGLVRRTLGTLALVGVVAAIGLWSAAPYLTQHLFTLKSDLVAVTTTGLRWIALSLPFALPAAGAVGGVEGLQKFRLVNSMRAPIGAALFLVPAFVAYLTKSVSDAIAGLALVRVVAAFIWMSALARQFPLRHRQPESGPPIASMFKFSGWLTVSNVIGPLMVYADRFYLASLYMPATVAHYSVPYDATFRATVLPGAAMNAVFPALAHHSDRPLARQALITTAGRLLTLFWFPPMVFGVLFAPELLAMWLGPEFAKSSSVILKCLLIGIFLNGYAYVPYAALHARARADITARLHLIELPLYFLALISAVTWFGVKGAAFAWTARVCADTALLFFCARKVVPESADSLSKTLATAIAGAIFLLAITRFDSILGRALVFLIVSIIAAIGAFRMLKDMQTVASN